MEAQANTTREQSNKMNRLATLARRYGGVGIKKSLIPENIVLAAHIFHILHILLYHHFF